MPCCLGSTCHTTKTLSQALPWASHTYGSEVRARKWQCEGMGAGKPRPGIWEEREGGEGAAGRWRERREQRGWEQGPAIPDATPLTHPIPGNNCTFGVIFLEEEKKAL